MAVDVESSVASCYIKREKMNNEGVDIDSFEFSSLIRLELRGSPCAGRRSE